MPSLGADMEAGVLVRRLKSPGDSVARGEIIAEVETDKGLIAVEAFEPGVLERWLVEPGLKVPVGTPLAFIASAGERSAPPAPASESHPVASAVPAPAAVPEPAPRAPVVATPSARQLALEHGLDLARVVGSGRHGVVTRGDVVAARAPDERARISPLARRRALELGVALDQVAASGPQGSIVAADVERAHAERPRAPAPSDAQRNMRKAIAAAMARSKREIPHYYVSHTIDLEPVLAWLQVQNERRSVDARLVPGVLLLRAVLLALRKFPELNAHFDGQEAQPSAQVHLGVAVSLRGGGLVAPAILDAHRMSLDELMSAFKDLVLRARSGKLKASEMSSPTITVTSLGERGVDEVLPVIVPPQVAMVGFGTIAVRPWVIDGRVEARSVVRASLAADHRVSDGHRGGLFLAAVAAHLQTPSDS